VKSLATAWRTGEVRPTHRQEAKPGKHGRTRPDPFAAVWPGLLGWLEERPDMEAKSMLKRLQASGFGEFADGQLRTLQRRVRVWRKQIVQQLVYGAELQSTHSSIDDLHLIQQLFFVDPQVEIETRDAATILGRLKCTVSTPAVSLPATYNTAVMKVYRQFSEEVAHRQTSLEHSSNLTVGQRYVNQELKAFVETLEEDDPRRTDVAVLQRVYNSYSLSAAVQTELRRVRNHKLAGLSLFTRLREIYDQHRLSQLQEQVRSDRQSEVPRIVCSEFLA
jgi:hypothetical protein